MSGWKRKYWTAWTTTTTSLASQWGLLINIDSATGDIARTTSGFIEDEKHWVSVATFTSTLSSKFTSSTPYGFSGDKCIYSNVTVVPPATFCRPIEINYLKATWTFKSPLKPSTKYRIKIPVYTNTTYTSWLGIRLITSTYTSADAYVADIVIGQLQASGILNKIYVSEFTTWATVWLLSQIYARFESGIVGEIAIDLNSMTLEEVIEPVANSLVTPSPSLVSFTAVGSTDNIDQSQLTINSTGSFNVAAQYQAQQFTPTKSKVTWFTLQKNANTWSPTGTMTFSIVNDSTDNPWTTVFASLVMSNATYLALADNTDFTVNLPCNLVAGTKYWLKVSYSVSSGTDYPMLKTWTPATAYTGWLFKYWTDWITYWTTYAGDYYFKTLYYKPTTNFKASQNNLNVSISADEDGFLNGSVINFLTWAYSWNSWLWLSNYLDSLHSAFFRTDSYWNPTTGNRIISWTWSATLIYKLPAWLTSLILNFVSTVAGWSTLEISSSIDNLSYTVNSTWLFSDTCTLIDGARYIKLRALWSNCKLETLTVTWTVDVSSYSVLKNYPTNKDIIKQYSTTLGWATTSATYRATKWGFPAIEYSSTEYQFLDVDTTATGSTVAFSELGTTYTTVADGASLAISSTSTPNIFVKANITANRLYSSSNDFNASSDKDGSLKQNITYQVIQ